VVQDADISLIVDPEYAQLFFFLMASLLMLSITVLFVLSYLSRRQGDVDPFYKDAYLVFRALCRLSMKPVSELCVQSIFFFLSLNPFFDSKLSLFCVTELSLIRDHTLCAAKFSPFNCCSTFWSTLGPSSVLVTCSLGGSRST